MMLDDDNMVVENIDNVELNPNIIKGLGWRIKSTECGEVVFEHDKYMNTTLIKRHRAHDRSELYRLCWMKNCNGADDVYVTSVTKVGELSRKLDIIINILSKNLRNDEE